MVLEILRLLLGIAIAVFHRGLAGRILEQERATDSYFRDRGIHLPEPLSEVSAQNLYFGIGIFVALFQIVRIWMLL
jgi:hypothetical protein